MEERFEQLVQEAAALERRPHVLVFRLLSHLQHVGDVELKGALQVSLEAADADARQQPRAGLAREARADARRAAGSHAGPARDRRTKVRRYVCW